MRWTSIVIAAGTGVVLVGASTAAVLTRERAAAPGVTVPSSQT